MAEARNSELATSLAQLAEQSASGAEAAAKVAAEAAECASRKLMESQEMAAALTSDDRCRLVRGLNA